MHGSSRLPAGFRSRLSRRWWLSPSCCGRFCRFSCDRFSRLRRGRLSRFDCGSFSRFGHGFSRSPQFRLGRFRSAMVAMLQRLDARSFFLRPQLSVCTVSALVLEVFRNRLSCHGGSVAELSPSELSNFGHSVTNSWAATRRLDSDVLPAAIDRLKNNPQYWRSQSCIPPLGIRHSLRD